MKAAPIPDSEILNAVRPGLATTGGLPSLISSAPMPGSGEVWRTYRQIRPNGDPLILVAQGASRDFNPSLPQPLSTARMERDLGSARRIRRRVQLRHRELRCSRSDRGCGVLVVSRAATDDPASLRRVCRSKSVARQLHDVGGRPPRRRTWRFSIRAGTRAAVPAGGRGRRVFCVVEVLRVARSRRPLWRRVAARALPRARALSTGLPSGRNADLIAIPPTINTGQADLLDRPRGL